MANPVFYIELQQTNWEHSRLQTAWQKLLMRHKRSLVTGELLANADKIANLDCRQDDVVIIKKKQQLLRQELLTGNSHELSAQGFVLKTLQTSDALRLYVVFNAEVMQGAKFANLWREWQVFYKNPELQLSVPGHEPIADYWQQRLGNLPASAAILPTVAAMENKPVAIEFEHHYGKISSGDYRRLKVMSQKQQIALTTLLLTSIQDIIAEHVEESRFRYNLVLANRLPLYPYLGDKADYATSVQVLPIVAATEQTFLQRAQRLAANLREDAKHLTNSVLPLLQQAEVGDSAWLPVEIECNLQQDLRETLLPEPADIVYYNGEDLKITYRVSVWEQGSELHYRCSMPRGLSE